MAMAGRGYGKDVVSKDINGPLGDRSPWGYKPQTGRVAPTNPKE